MGFMMDDEEELAQKPMDPRVVEYLTQKNAASQFSDENRMKAKADADERKSGLGWAQFAAGVGDAFAGRSPSESAKNFDGIRKGIDESTIGDFDSRKKAMIEDLKFKNSQKEFENKQAKFDPNSNSSMAFRKMMEANFPAIAKHYGDSWGNVTAEDQENIFKPLQLKENIEARKEQAKILAGDRAENRAAREFDKQSKLDEKMQGLKTPYGLANNEDDAKKLKEAYESKKNFDGKIKEMIALRKKHGGGASLNREDVGRGKQLSKDLLLEYKNMAKLGVLSKSDEDIINAIIPEDPLAYNSPLAAFNGQDPILHKLEKFKGDSDKDFSTKVSTRTREGLAAGNKVEKKVVKRQINPKTGETRLVYDDDSTEIISSNVAGGR